MTLSIERLYSAPSEVFVDGEETRKQFRILTRDSCWRLWALGDGQVLRSSTDGLEWSDLSLNLKADGTFTAYVVFVRGETTFLFVRNRHGLRLYRLEDGNVTWRIVSTIDAYSSCVVSDAGPDRFTLLSRERGTPAIFRSVDGGLTWSRKTFGKDGVPVHLQICGSGLGLCCLRQGFREDDPDGPESSALYSTTDFGMTWRHVANLETMILAAVRMSDDQVLVGGSHGFLAAFDLSGRRTLTGRCSDDIVAVDHFFGSTLAIAESERTPIQHQLAISKNGDEWVHRPFHLDDRIVGLKMISEEKYIVCTYGELYICKAAA